MISMINLRFDAKKICKFVSGGIYESDTHTFISLTHTCVCVCE